MREYILAITVTVLLVTNLLVSVGMRGEHTDSPLTPPIVCGEKTLENSILRNLYHIFALSGTVSRDLALEIALHTHYYAEAYEIDPDLLLSVMDVESNFDPMAKSNMGAIGLMQIMHTVWGEDLGLEEYELYNPRTNISAGAYVLNHYFRFFGDMDLALVAYYRGPSETMKLIDFGEIDSCEYLWKVRRVYDRIKGL